MLPKRIDFGSPNEEHKVLKFLNKRNAWQIKKHSSCERLVYQRHTQINQTAINVKLICVPSIRRLVKSLSSVDCSYWAYMVLTIGSEGFLNKDASL